MEEIHLIWDEIRHMMGEANQALNELDEQIAQKMLKREEKINRLHDQFKENHITRLNEGSCHMDSGFVFLEYLDNMEKIGDRLTNMAQSTISKMKWVAKRDKTA